MTELRRHKGVTLSVPSCTVLGGRMYRNNKLCYIVQPVKSGGLFCVGLRQSVVLCQQLNKDWIVRQVWPCSTTGWLRSHLSIFRTSNRRLFQPLLACHNQSASFKLWWSYDENSKQLQELHLKAQQEDEEETQEATLCLAASNEISVDAAVASILIRTQRYFDNKRKTKNRTQGSLVENW